MNNFIMPWFILFIISTIAYKINKTNLYRIYSIVGFVVATTLYLQSIGLLIFNIPARPINLLPVSADDFHFWNYFRGERPSAFFPEPQAYASFMLPLLFLTLNRRKFIYSTFIGGSIFFSTSSQGILLVIILLIFMFVIHPNKWYLKIAYIAFIIIIVGAFLVLPVFNFAYEKIIKIFNPELLKDNIRLVRGYLIYSTFNANDLLLGIGDGNQQMYVENNLYLFWDWAKAHISDNEQLMGYSTTIARILIAVGPLPLLFFIQMIYKMYKYDDKIMRPLLIIILFSSFAQTLLFNSWFFFYYLFYIGYCDKEKYGENFYIFKIKS
ncbi:MAG: hypothetical protein FWF52_06605 [Candidatus Azobacteroides sp.]|nr:hypothetical protein [Candidatus Azobacteroides sp.]